jgi:hypothetical protein
MGCFGFQEVQMRIPIRRFAIDQNTIINFDRALIEASKYLKEVGEELEFDKIELRPDQVYRYWFTVFKEIWNEEEE